MKSLRTTVALVGLFAALAFVPAARAADLSLFAGYYDTSDYDDSYGGGLRVAFFDRVQLELGATYYDTFSNPSRIGGLELPEIELELDVLPVDVGVRFNFGDSPVYIAGGGTLYVLDTNFGNVDDEFGFYARIGSRIGRSFFIEGGYRDVEGTVDELRIEDIGQGGFERGVAEFDLSGFFANLGWSF